MQQISTLTPELIELYAGRKQEGVLSLLVDTYQKRVYPVPHTMEHVNVACEILGITIKQLQESPQQARHLIPVNIFLRNGKIVGLMNGKSGLEMGYRVKHERESQDIAQRMVWTLITSSKINGVELGNIEINKIFYS